MSVKLVEWGDFECPYCRRAAPAVREVLAELGDRVTYTWRHFPITEKHPHAAHAAQAAEAARAQGRFKEMHDALFAHQEALEEEDLVRYAEEIGLDVDRFADDLRAGRYADVVAAERAEGEKAGVSGTPTFFIAGERYRGFYDAETLLDALKDAGA